MAIEAKKLAAFAAAKGKGGKGYGKAHAHGMKHGHGTVELHDEHGKMGHPEAHMGKGMKHGHGMPHGKEMPDLDMIAQMIDSGKGDPKLTELGRELGEGVPHWAKSHELFEMALEAVEERWDEFEDPYVVVVHLYVAMGGQIDPHAVGGEEDEGEEMDEE